MLATGLLAGWLACSSNGTTQTQADVGAGPDTAVEHESADAMCRAPAPQYGPDTKFETDQSAPQPPMECPKACGDSLWGPALSFTNVDVALPYGSCAAGTPACWAGATVPCRCAGSTGPVHGFVCSCESGTWVCRIRSLGLAACSPCDGGSGG